MSEYRPTSEQKALLNHNPDYHARVSAGPGSGKSATLIQLISLLKDADENLKVKMLTFTRAATTELAKKISDDPALATIKPSTVHSFAIKILIENPNISGLPRPLRIADEWEYRNIVRPSLAQRARVYVRQLDKLQKEMASDWESLRPEEDADVSQEERARFLGAWREHSKVYGYTLLEQLPYTLKQVLEQYPDINGLNYEFIVVDEYQDLNACELAILKSMANKGSVILAAGDEDQSIYSNRRAAPEGLGRFLEHYPQAADYNLTVAQRYGSKIINWSSHVIEGDPERRSGKPRLIPAESASEGEVALLAFGGERAEARGVGDIVRKLLDSENIPPSEIMILMRSDHNGRFSKKIKEELNRREIQYSDPGYIKDVLNGTPARKMLACMRLLANKEDSLAWASLIELEDGIGDSFRDAVYRRAVTDNTGFGQALTAMYNEGFADIPSTTVANRAKQLLDSTTEWLHYHSLPTEEPENRWGNWMIENTGDSVVPSQTEEMHQILTAVDESIEFGSEFSRYLGQIWPLAKDWAQAESSGVRIMSMAAAKGLTVRATIIIGLEDDIVPHPRADSSEERRLLYVAMTRAKEILIGTWVRSRRGSAARSGSGDSRTPRRYSSFLTSGPVRSQEGLDFIASRWGSD